jgi:hypothetical protein
MRLQATYRGPEAQRFALEPPPYGEPGAYFVLMLAYDADGNEVGRKRIGD